jgi:hypothetical protein
MPEKKLSAHLVGAHPATVQILRATQAPKEWRFTIDKALAQGKPPASVLRDIQAGRIRG